MKILPLLLACVGAVLLTGCVGTRQFVPLPNQANRVDDPAKGRIYVMRPANVGTAIAMNVSDDGKPIGVTGPDGYLCWERSPGETIISSSSEGVSSAPLSVQAGEVYYVFQHIRMGLLIARSELEVVDETKGKKVLKGCKPARVNLNGGPRGQPVAVDKPGGT